MKPDNAELARRFDEIADLLELEQANPFRIRAYRHAARTLESWPEAMHDWAASGRDFAELPSIGHDLAAKIQELLSTGTCAQLERLRGEVPAGLTDLLKVPGLGPARVRTLYHELGVHTANDVLDAATAGRIRHLHGFGAASEQRIRDAVAGHLKRSSRLPLGHALPRVDALLNYLRQAEGSGEVIAAGSVRRCRDTVGDVDILVTARSSEAVMTHLCSYDQVERVLMRGPTRTSVVLRDQLQVDLRVVADADLGAALVYFTGSKAHNIALRRIARTKRLKLNEYGVFKGDSRIAGDSEASVYAALDMDMPPPEMREDRGEIELARRHRLPTLITRADLRGDLHAHTRASDGRETLRAMAEAARAAGLEYLAITDHSPALRIAHGLDPARLRRQIHAIDTLNDSLDGITVLKGIEVDILEDGRLDLPDQVLAQLDLVVGAIHSHFTLSRQRQTERVLRAMDHPCFSILAHPNGRLLQARDACDMDMERIVAHARDRGCFLELNAQPQRLDLFDTQCALAREAGVRISIASDAHAGSDLDWLALGVSQARRGWLQPGHVLNTLPLAELRPLLAATMQVAAK